MRKHILILPDGAQITAGRGVQNAITGLKLTESVNDSTELSLGSTCAACLEVTILSTGEPPAVTQGDEIVLLEEVDGIRGQLGIFRVETPSKPTPNTTKLVCYDRIIALDKDLTQWLKELTGWPYKLSTFASMVCEACGLTLADISGAPNADYMVQKFSRSGITGRSLMQWCAELCCRFVRADPNGQIEMAWYRETDNTLTPSGPRYYISGGMSRADYETDPIDVVQLRLADTQEGYLIPEGTGNPNAYILKGNPLLSGSTDQLLDILQNMRNALAGFAYTPCKAAFPVGRGIQAGDIVTVTDRNGQKFRTIIMSKVRSGHLETVESTGSKRRDNVGAHGSYRDTAANNQQTAQETAQNAVNGQTQADIFNKLTNNGAMQGLFMKDGQIYVNVSYLATGVIQSADGTVQMDLANNTVTINGTRDGLKTQIVLSSSGMSAYGESKAGVMEHVLEFQFGVGGKPTAIFNNAWKESMGMAIAAVAGVLSLGTSEASTEIFGSNIKIDPIMDLNIMGKVVEWKENSNGTYTLIGR